MNGDDNGGNDPCEETHKYMTIKYYCECQEYGKICFYDPLLICQEAVRRVYPCMIG